MAISESVSESIIRSYPEGKECANMDPFTAAGIIRYAGNVAIVEAVHGRVNRRTVLELLKLCKQRQCQYLLAHRAPSKVFPKASRVPEGLPFAGWWFVDLTRYNPVE